MNHLRQFVLVRWLRDSLLGIVATAYSIFMPLLHAQEIRVKDASGQVSGQVADDLLSRAVFLRKRMRFAEYAIDYKVTFREAGIEVQKPLQTTYEYRVDFTREIAKTTGKMENVQLNELVFVRFGDSDMLPGSFFDVRAAGFESIYLTRSNPSFARAIQSTLGKRTPGSLEVVSKDGVYNITSIDEDLKYTLVIDSNRGNVPIEHRIERGKRDLESGNFEVADLLSIRKLEWKEFQQTMVPVRIVQKHWETQRGIGVIDPEGKRREVDTEIAIDWRSVNEPLRLNESP